MQKREDHAEPKQPLQILSESFLSIFKCHSGQYPILPLRIEASPWKKHAIELILSTPSSESAIAEDGPEAGLFILPSLDSVAHWTEVHLE
jgi:hypothetical protein